MYRVRRALLAAGAALALAGLFASEAAAQCITNVCPPPPPPLPPADAPVFVDNAVTSGMFDLGTKFLWSLNHRGSTSPGSNTDGGGAAGDPAVQRFRTWAEGYGLWSRTRDHDGISGDTRRTAGLVGGIGATLAPGASVGLAVDEGWTRIEVGGPSQTARFNLTQVGANTIIEVGQWTLGLAGIYGVANVDTSRVTMTPGTLATTAFRARLWGTMGEIGYLIPLGNARIVPKAAFDWIHVETPSFAEIGGLDPATVASQKSERARAYAGLEVGRSWVADRTLYDISAYGRFVDILSETGMTLQVTSPSAPGVSRTVQGTSEGRYGFDAGASASVRFAPSTRLYVNYDARLRENYQAHVGTLGVEFKW